MTPLLLDQGLPRDAARMLRELGHDCLHVGEIGMPAAEDREILAWGREQRRTVVTLDADFHAELAISGASTPSVVQLRMQGLDGPATARLLDALRPRVHRSVAPWLRDLCKGGNGEIALAAHRLGRIAAGVCNRAML